MRMWRPCIRHSGRRAYGVCRLQLLEGKVGRRKHARPAVWLPQHDCLSMQYACPCLQWLVHLEARQCMFGLAGRCCQSRSARLASRCSRHVPRRRAEADKECQAAVKAKYAAVYTGYSSNSTVSRPARRTARGIRKRH